LFTGLIEETGIVKEIKAIPGGKVFIISCNKVLEDLQIDHSVAVNGVCLTVTSLKTDSFEATAVAETLLSSTLKLIRRSEIVNLERAMKLSDRLGGHLVQGHVDSTAVIRSIKKESAGFTLTLELDNKILKYVISKGSITINGISLTIARQYSNKIDIAVIPHTWANTNLHICKNGSLVNIEVDYIARYVEKLTNIKFNNY